MATSVVSVNDGPRTTVNDMVGEPKLIPVRVLDRLKNNFITETVLRDAGPNSNGLVSYSESTPLYLDDDVELIAEFSEIPVAAGQIGTRRIAIGYKKGIGVRVSKEMKDENRMDDVNRQIKQLTNTMIRAEDRLLRTLLADASVPTIAAAAAWDTVNGKPRRDLALAMEVVNSAKPTATQDDDIFGFEADTSIFPGGIVPVLIDNPEFLAVYKDSLSPDAIEYTGRLERDVMGMVALKSRSWPTDRVLVCERKTVGFYSDTRPLQVTELYPEGNGPNGGSTESWRSDATRKRAAGLDQPKAACWITGVKTP